MVYVPVTNSTAFVPAMMEGQAWTAAVTAMLDRLLHHGHILKWGPQSWRSREKKALKRPQPMR